MSNSFLSWSESSPWMQMLSLFIPNGPFLHPASPLPRFTVWTAKDTGRWTESVAVGTSDWPQADQHDDRDRENSVCLLYYWRGKHVSWHWNKSADVLSHWFTHVVALADLLKRNLRKIFVKPLWKTKQNKKHILQKVEKIMSCGWTDIYNFFP